LKLLQVVPSGHQVLVFAWNVLKKIWMSRFKGIKFLVINCVFGFLLQMNNYVKPRLVGINIYIQSP
jgi:hypothetical protein